ncbi:hypothetical protein D3C87_1475140 [compost metagenome]
MRAGPELPLPDGSTHLHRSFWWCHWLYRLCHYDGSFPNGATGSRNGLFANSLCRQSDSRITGGTLSLQHLGLAYAFHDDRGCERDRWDLYHLLHETHHGAPKAANR